jgi:hypothetical protein
MMELEAKNAKKTILSGVQAESHPAGGPVDFGGNGDGNGGGNGG